MGQSISDERLAELIGLGCDGIARHEACALAAEVQGSRATAAEARIEQAYKAGFDFAMMTKSEDEGWQDIESAPEGMQILVWETDYGWLLACKDRHHTTGWAAKSSGNFYWTMPQRVVDKLTHWRPLGDSPASQEAPK